MHLNTFNIFYMMLNTTIFHYYFLYTAVVFK